MIFSQDRGALRKMYAQAWQKRSSGEPLTPLEAQIAGIVAEHPEYHDALADDAIENDYAPEGGLSNPFLHMGLHLGLREQVATDRPAGIRAIHARLTNLANDAHAAEHSMIECLAETLWEAQRNAAPPDEAAYLEKLRRIPVSSRNK